MNPDTTPTPIYDSIIATKSKVAHAAFIKTLELLLNKERAARQKAERELAEKTNEVERLREKIEVWRESATFKYNDRLRKRILEELFASQKLREEIEKLKAQLARAALQNK